MKTFLIVLADLIGGLVAIMVGVWLTAKLSNLHSDEAVRAAARTKALIEFANRGY